MHCRILRVTGFAAGVLVVLPSFAPSATAQLVLSANDGKAVLVDGVNTVPIDPKPDNVTIVDLGSSPPKVVAEIKVATSVVGPPSSVAVARDESFALVTAATKIDPNDAKKVAPDNKVSVIDLKASPPAVIAVVELGAGAAGAALNPDGNLALVANRSEGTVSVFTIANKALTAVGKVQLGDAKSGPSAIAFTPDGKTALVTRDGDTRSPC